VSVVANHLDNFLFNIGHNLLVGFVLGAFHIEYRALHILVYPGQPLHFECPRAPPGLARPNFGSHKFFEGVSRSDYASRLVKRACASKRAACFRQFR
jgi:hypothetical protein